MLDQLCNPNKCFWITLLFQSIFVPIYCSFKYLLQVSKNSMLSFKDKVITGTWSLVQFSQNVASKINVGGTLSVGGLEPGLAGTSRVLNISDSIHFLDHEKWSSTSQLIKGNSRNLQNYSQVL